MDDRGEKTGWGMGRWKEEQGKWVFLQGVDDGGSLALPLFTYSLA